jgi:hypothetical protein
MDVCVCVCGCVRVYVCACVRVCGVSSRIIHVNYLLHFMGITHITHGGWINGLFF